jgi:hypothetical protein
MNQDYLPSKQFIHRVIAIAIILAIVLGIYEIARYFGGKSKILPKSKLVVKSLTEQDANNNTIPDWEEKLWGLDPTKNGPENKEFILAKREVRSWWAEIEIQSLFSAFIFRSCSFSSRSFWSSSI